MKWVVVFLLLIPIAVAMEPSCFDNGALIVSDVKDKDSVQVGIPGTDSLSTIEGIWLDQSDEKFTFKTEELVFVDPESRVYSIKIGDTQSSFVCPGLVFSCLMFNASIDTCFEKDGYFIARYLIYNFGVDHRQFRFNNPYKFTYEVMTKAGMTYVNSPEAVSKSFRDIEISVREYSNANLYTLKWKSEEPVEKFSVSYRGCTNSESYVAKKCSKVATCLYTDECEDDEICSDSACQKVFCHECQYIENHRCYDYGCCTSNDCRNTQFCSKNECVDLLCSEGYKAKDHLCVETPEEVIVINVTEAEIGEEPSIVCERFQRLKNGKCVNWFWHLIENVQKFLHLA